jgi:Spy/CpxP family protein refolding chaperone
MDYFSKNRLAAWAIVLLLLLNTATLVTVWITGRHHGRGEFMGRRFDRERGKGMGMGEDGPLHFLEKRLELSPEQTAQFKPLMEAHFKAIHELMDSIHRQKEAMLDLINSPQDPKAMALAKNIGELQTRLDISTFNHFAKLHSLCTDKQKEKFDRIVREMLARRDHPMPGGHEGPPPPPDDGPER